jgi:hypothetical protein
MDSLQLAPTGLLQAGAGWLVAWLVLGIVGLVVQYRQRR